GKSSVAIDLESPDGQAAVRALAAEADVLIENFKLGGLARYGLGYDALAVVNPRLVYCSVTGFGQDGPYAPRAGYDFIIQGMGGAMSLTGEPDGEPQKSGVAYADLFTGLYATVAILAALRERDRTGRGAHIDMALLDTQVAVLGNQALNWMVSGKVPRRMGNGHANLVPYQAFRTSDGDVIVAVGNDRQFERLCALLDLPGLAGDERYRTNPARVVHRAELVPVIAEAIARRGTAELSGALQAAGIPAGPINAIDAVFADPQIVHRGLRLEGEIPGLASPIVIDGKRQSAPPGGPALGGSDARFSGGS
ncbi:MAG: hypothetical protein QOH86_713, partial [Sphingomonadales bacterium]|nr:hypothetical protein [Sphingomonadales bacterium]